jgi:hypothetical protein
MTTGQQPGGGLLGPIGSCESFYQAQFVAAVRRLEKEKNQSREWVFKWLMNEESLTTPKKAAGRLALLPKRHRNHKNSNALRTAFNVLPKQVREHPERYLPSRTVASGNWLSGPQAWMLNSPRPARGLLGKKER